MHGRHNHAVPDWGGDVHQAVDVLGTERPSHCRVGGNHRRVDLVDDREVRRGLRLVSRRLGSLGIVIDRHCLTGTSEGPPSETPEEPFTLGAGAVIAAYYETRRRQRQRTPRI